MSLVPRAPAQPWKRVPCERPAPSPTTRPGRSRSALRPEGWGQIRAEDSPLSPKKVCPHRASRVLGPLRDQMWEERGSHPSLPGSSPRQRRAVKVRVVALPLMVPSRAGDIRDLRAHRTDRRTGRGGPGSVAHVSGSFQKEEEPHPAHSARPARWSPADSRLRSLPDHVGVSPDPTPKPGE